MSDRTWLPAVEHSVRVPLSRAVAFDLFTRRMASWWPFRGHSCYGDDAAAIEFEARVGGAVTEVSRGGERTRWGHLTAWQPPEGFEMRWHPGIAAEQATVLAVRFVEVVGGTQVSIHHSGWESRGDEAASKRDQYDRGWPATLREFAVRSAQEMPR